MPGKYEKTTNQQPTGTITKRNGMEGSESYNETEWNGAFGVDDAVTLVVAATCCDHLLVERGYHCQI